uniref:Uncharacterized protein n=1 Tax=Parascaris equorum TaxID=6256 RepID=A0A914SCQ6_PAREQ
MFSDKTQMFRQERKSFLLREFWKRRASQGRETLFDTWHMCPLLKLLLATKGEVG